MKFYSFPETTMDFSAEEKIVRITALHRHRDLPASWHVHIQSLFDENRFDEICLAHDLWLRWIMLWRVVCMATTDFVRGDLISERLITEFIASNERIRRERQNITANVLFDVLPDCLIGCVFDLV